MLGCVLYNNHVNELAFKNIIPYNISKGNRYDENYSTMAVFSHLKTNRICYIPTRKGRRVVKTPRPLFFANTIFQS